MAEQETAGAPGVEQPDAGHPHAGHPHAEHPHTGHPDAEQPDPDQALGELNTRMGIRIVDWNPQRMVATMPVAGNRQPYGLLHGGASCTLAETLGSTAAAMNAQPGRFPVGVEINASHHRSVTEGTVTAVCTPLHVGAALGTFLVEITDEHGRRTCTARLTCAYLKHRPAGGSR